MTARGITNNNPGNLRKSDTAWQGLADVQSDPAFFVFKTPQFGIRALARTLLTYKNQYDLDTVRKIIGRWAPPSENNTDAYVVAVSAGVGVDPDAPIDVDSAPILKKLVCAIILHENGVQPYTDAIISEGIRAAGVSDGSPPPLHQQPSFVAKAGTAVAGAAYAASQHAPMVKDWASQLGAFDGAPMIAHVKTALLTIGGGLLLLGLVSDYLKHRSAA